MKNILSSVEDHFSLRKAPSRELTERQQLLVDFIVESEERRENVSFLIEVTLSSETIPQALADALKLQCASE